MIAKLRELANQVAGGRWRVDGTRIVTDGATPSRPFPIADRVHQNDSAYIAACSPANILRLIAVVDAVEKWRDGDYKEMCDWLASVPDVELPPGSSAERDMVHAIDALRKGDEA